MTEPYGATTTVAERPASDSPGRWSVHSTHPVDRKRRLFSSVSERRAKAWVERRCPRGEEMYLRAPTGETFSYVAERQGDNGTDAEQWVSFDPDTWIPPAEQEPPGQSAWGDIEG